jgi:hypothetical protein
MAGPSSSCTMSSFSQTIQSGASVADLDVDAQYERAEQVRKAGKKVSSSFVESLLHKHTGEYIPTHRVQLTGRPIMEFTTRH